MRAGTVARRRLGVAALLTIVVAGCGTEPPVGGAASPVVGGHVGTPAEIGATVAVLLPDALCSGTLVAPRVVITAAHCSYHENEQADGSVTWGPLYDPSTVTVAVGAIDVTTGTGGEIHSVVQVWADPNFPALAGSNADHWPDIGALVLADPVTSTAPVPILDASQLDTELTPRRILGIAGYGQTDAAGLSTSPAGVLNIGQVPFISRGNSEIIAGDPGGVDTCYGDSGGPLYVDTPSGKRVVGVTSRGAGYTTRCDSGTIYTTATAYIGEIQSATGQSLAPPVDAGAPPPPPPPPPPDAGTTVIGSAPVDAGVGPTEFDSDGSVAADAGVQYRASYGATPHALVGGCSAADGDPAPGVPAALGALLLWIAIDPRRRRRSAHRG